MIFCCVCSKKKKCATTFQIIFPFWHNKKTGRKCKKKWGICEKCLEGVIEKESLNRLNELEAKV